MPIILNSRRSLNAAELRQMNASKPLKIWAEFTCTYSQRPSELVKKEKKRKLNAFLKEEFLAARGSSKWTSSIRWKKNEKSGLIYRVRIMVKRNIPPGPGDGDRTPTPPPRNPRPI